MHARIASFEGGDLARLRQINEERRSSGTDGAPEGLRGVIVLVDHERNRRLFVTFFDSADAIAAAEQRFEEMGDEIPEDVRGRRTSIEVCEVLFDEGERGGFARVRRLEGPPENVDAATRYAVENILPKARELAGWTGAISLADRSTGKGTLITFWESAEAMRESEEAGDRLREEAARAADESIAGVERYEVVFSERR